MDTHPWWRPFGSADFGEAEIVREAQPPLDKVDVVPPDPSWPALFASVRDRLMLAVGDKALAIQHIGSTAVPGLWAKPFVDIDLIVADSSMESEYVPLLEAAGFDLIVRFPGWEEHRVLRGQQPITNLHVCSPEATEPKRHVAFRDWLSTHPEDRDAYAATKRNLAEQGFADTMVYNLVKPR